MFAQIKNYALRVLWMACLTGIFACGKLPTAQPGGNDFGDDDAYGDGDGDGATYIAVYSAVGESMQVIETEHFLAAVSIGKPLELSEFYSDSFDLNNGFDISAPVEGDGE